jgi:butyryl-CoA dehydrogenase
MWLDVATCAARAPADAAQRGRLAACRYFFRYELPKIGAWLGVVATRDDTCRTIAEESF